MRPTRWLVAAPLLVALGCGSSSENSAPQADASSGPPTVSEAVADPAASPVESVAQPAVSQTAEGEANAAIPTPPQDAPPQEVVRWFLEATRRGDHQIAAAMLSRKAIEETDKRGLSVKPPGSPTMKYTIEEAENAPNGDAYVKCLWTETIGDADHVTEVVWVLKSRQAGWRITGMAAQVSPESDPIFIDFENPEGLAERVGGPGAEGVAETGSESPAYNAQQPGDTTRR